MNTEDSGFIFQDAYAITDRAALRRVPSGQILLAVCHEGAACLSIGTRLFVVEKNAVVLIAAEDAYVLQSAPGNIAIWSMLTLHPEQLLGDKAPEAARLDPSVLTGPHFPHVLGRSEYTGVQTLVSQMVADLRLSAGQGSPQLAQLIRKLFVQLKRLPTAVAYGSSFEGLMPALEIMFQEYRGVCAESVLADSCQLSLGQFQKEFTQVYGCAVSEFVDRLKIFHAAAYISDHACDAATAMQQVAWQDTDSFDQLFQRFIGCSAKQWRKQNH